MPISPDEFKLALRQFPAGVTIVTIQAGEDRHGLTVSAFVSVSAEPPLIAVLINASGNSHDLMTRPGATFAVNILKEGQDELSNNFAWGDHDRFAMGDWTTAETGAPVLNDALAWLDCTIHKTLETGSHLLVIGEVQASTVSDNDENPLVYWNRGYRQLLTESSD